MKGEKWHSWLERRPIQLTIFATVAILIGGIIQIVPTIMVKSNIPTIASVKPYTPLELEGRDLYIREGCVGCHSQMVRPFRSEVERYGPQSKAGEFVYDHPFLWGSKRTGPDLLREGGKYNDNWHFNHFWRSTKYFFRFDYAFVINGCSITKRWIFLDIEENESHANIRSSLY
jgi:cytochrome c oxidase cbb3-type subunit I/II